MTYTVAYICQQLQLFLQFNKKTSSDENIRHKYLKNCVSHWYSDSEREINSDCPETQ